MKKLLRFSKERLIALRESKGISHLELERLSGLNREAIWKIEKGYNSPRTDTLLKIIFWLGIKITDLLEEVE